MLEDSIVLPNAFIEITASYQQFYIEEVKTQKLMTFTVIVRS